jgi:hypothetical protein
VKDTFEPDVLSNLSQGTTWSNSCIDMSLDEMWKIFPAWTMFRTFAIIHLSWAEPITKLLNSLT